LKLEIQKESYNTFEVIKKAFLPDIADFFFELLDKLTVMAPFPLANNRTSVLSWAFEFVVLPPY
jgi:hypothetical protein